MENTKRNANSKAESAVESGRQSAPKQKDCKGSKNSKAGRDCK